MTIFTLNTGRNSHHKAGEVLLVAVTVEYQTDVATKTVQCSWPGLTTESSQDRRGDIVLLDLDIVASSAVLPRQWVYTVQSVSLKG